MLGPPKARCLDRPTLVSLEALVPQDHFYRSLEATLDLSCVRDWVADCYAAGGRPSIDPVVFFKLQLIMFFEGIRSERHLLELASLNLAHRRYLGYPLDEPLPDHSSLTKIRQRLGVPIFRRFFEHVVQRCSDAGLVWGKELFFDATRVRANASLDSLVPRLKEVVDGHLVDLFGPGADSRPATDGPSAAPAEPPAPVAENVIPWPRPEAEAGALAEPPTEAEPSAPASARWDLLETCRLDPERPSSPGYERKGDWVISTTDPDAAPMKTLGERAALGYHDHYVVDGGKHRVILHALVTPADVMENEPMLDQLRRVIFRWQVQPERVVADTTYGTVENIRQLEAMGIRAYVPLPDFDGRTPFFGKGRFTYDAEHDEYRCPAGQSLRRRKAKYTEGVVVYQAEAPTCNACPLKAQCTASDRGRQVRRAFDEDCLDRVRADHATPAYQKAMRKRQVWVEPLFGEAKQWHGLRQFRLRGLKQVNMEGLLVAAGQNLKRWLAATGWGRRYGPAGRLILPSPAAWLRIGGAGVLLRYAERFL